MEQLSQARRRVLVIDDDPSVCEAVKLAVWQEFDVEFAHDGPAGLAALRAARFDAALIDCILPGPMLGDAVCDVIHGTWPEVPTVLMSGFVEDGMLEDMMYRRGAMACLPKPFGAMEVRSILAAVLPSGANGA